MPLLGRRRIPLSRHWRHAIVVFGLVLTSAPLSAADSGMQGLLDLFFGRQKPAAQAVEVLAPVAEAVALELDPNAGGEFLPLLFKCSARELHYLKKVTQPDDKAYADLKIAAARAARDLARTYAREKQANRRAENWSRPRPFITQALAKRASELLAPEVVAVYREEVEAREAALAAACQGMMLRAIDNRLTLLPEQIEPTRQAVVMHWRAEQSTNLMIFLYDEYLQLPDVRSLSKALNERQQRLLQSRNQGRIGFSWEQELGLAGRNDNGQEIAGLENLANVDVTPKPVAEQQDNVEPAQDEIRPQPGGPKRAAKDVAPPAAATEAVPEPATKGQP
ncbi:MAG: hypothetical protein ACK5Q5_12455 [Planctomycetaceae bacterium]